MMMMMMMVVVVVEPPIKSAPLPAAQSLPQGQVALPPAESPVVV